MSEERVYLPSARLPRSAGRPRKAENGHSPGTATPGGLDDSGQERRALASPASAPLPPRLLDLAGAAAYISVSPWTVRDLLDNGTLKRVPLICRIDTLDELDYFKNGGILQYVLRQLAG